LLSTVWTGEKMELLDTLDLAQARGFQMRKGNIDGDENDNVEWVGDFRGPQAAYDVACALTYLHSNSFIHLVCPQAQNNHTDGTHEGTLKVPSFWTVVISAVLLILKHGGFQSRLGPNEVLEANRQEKYY
jgi:hypothetical protein